MVVVDDKDSLAFALRPLDATAQRLVPANLEAKLGAIYEVGLESLVVLRMLVRQLASYRGAALIVDYGYAETALAGTLQAVSGHATADPLDRPGEIDLTAHVDFGALKQVAAADPALRVSGPLGQGAFLTNLGIELRARQLKHVATPEQAAAIDAAVERLTVPAAMGTLFKAMAITPAGLADPPGF